MTITPPPTSGSTAALAGAIVRAAIIESALIAIGVALYLSTGNIVWMLGAVLAGAAVMIAMVVAPIVRAQAAAQKGSDGGPRIVE